MGFLHGKRALITGVLSQRSIAWGIANAMHREGAQLAFTYVNDKLRPRVDEAANAFGSNIVLPCDVTSDEQIDKLFADLGKHWDGFDILVHSIGFAPGEALSGEFLDGLTRENYRIAHDISAYSLPALAKAARPLMKGRSGSGLSAIRDTASSMPSRNVRMMMRILTSQPSQFRSSKFGCMSKTLGVRCRVSGLEVELLSFWFC